MKTRYPATLVISLCVPLAAMALARLGTVQLASSPLVVSQDSLGHTREQFLNTLPPKQRSELCAHLSSLTRFDRTEAQMDEDTLLIDVISYYAHKAEYATSPAQAQQAREEAQLLIPRLSTPWSRQVALRRLARTQTDKPAPLVESSPGPLHPGQLRETAL